tara:strand:+ start:2102 stop:2782 length:681 start_codon:yes stop_codon:yes gene_type:complete
MKIDPYQILGIKFNSTFTEIKLAYRNLVKKHHPDKGGDKNKIQSINAAWEILRDQKSRDKYDLSRSIEKTLLKEREANNNNFTKPLDKTGVNEEYELHIWMKKVYSPIDKFVGEIINAFPSQLRALSGDPYDDLLMKSFCDYLSKSQAKIKKIHSLFEKTSAPISCRKLAIDIYHCFSQVEDALQELERYTYGYVDNYLHDGNEMLREAKAKRLKLHLTRRSLPKY